MSIQSNTKKQNLCNLLRKEQRKIKTNMAPTPESLALLRGFTQALNLYEEIGNNVEDWDMNSIRRIAPEYDDDESIFCPHTAIFLRYLVLERTLSHIMPTKLQRNAAYKRYKTYHLKNAIMHPPAISIEDLYQNNPEMDVAPVWQWAVEVAAIWTSLPEAAPASNKDETLTLAEAAPYFRTYMESLLGRTYHDKYVLRKDLLLALESTYAGLTGGPEFDQDIDEIVFLNLAELPITVRTGYESITYPTILEGIDHAISIVQQTRQTNIAVENWNRRQPRNSGPPNTSPAHILKKYASANFFQKVRIRMQTGQLRQAACNIHVKIPAPGHTYEYHIDSNEHSVENVDRLLGVLYFAAYVQTEHLETTQRIMTYGHLAKHLPRQS